MTYTINPNAKDVWIRDNEDSMDLCPITDASTVYLENGITIEQELGEGSMVSNVATVDTSMNKVIDGTLEGAYESCLLRGNTKFIDNDTGEVLDTFEEGRNLSLVDVKMPILRNVGKNWLYYGETLGTPSITSYSLSNNELTITNDGTKSYQQINFVYKDLLNYKGKTLTLSGYATPNKADLKPCFQVVFQDSSGKTYYYGSTNSANTTKRMSRTFTIPYDISSDYTPRISFIVHNANESGYSGTAVFSEIMLEESPSPTTYENHKTNILRTSEEVILREVNGVQDTYNALTGEYVRRISEVVFDGSSDEDWSVNKNIAGGKQFVYNASLGAKGGNATVISDKLPSIVEANESHVENIWIYNGTTIVIHKNLQDANELKTWLSQNPITVQYELAEPVTTIVKPSTMTPFAYQNGHVILESGYEGQSLLPALEYSTMVNKTGQIKNIGNTILRQEKQLTTMEKMLIQNIIDLGYNNALTKIKLAIEEVK